MFNTINYINGVNGPQFLGPSSFSRKQNLNNGLTNSIMGMPLKFRNEDGNNTFSQGRKISINTPICNSIIISKDQSIRVDSSTLNCNKVIDNIGWSRSNVHTNHGRHSSFSIQSGKKNEIKSSDQYIQQKKNIAIGLNSSNYNGDQFSFKSNNNSNLNTSNSALKKARSGGCVAPAKKGAIIY